MIINVRILLVDLKYQVTRKNHNYNSVLKYYLFERKTNAVNSLLLTQKIDARIQSNICLII